MNILPKIRKCPTCEGINFIKTNGVNYENNFQSLRGWTLKKNLNCRKCNIKLGFFYNNKTKEEKVVWLDLFKCEDFFYDKLNQLKSNQLKIKKNKKKFSEIAKEILNIQNQIRLNEVKVKIKSKIKNQRLLIGHVY